MTFLDGKSISGALELNLSTGTGKSKGAAIKIENDRSTIYKVQLEAGKKYEFWSEDAAVNDGPSKINYDKLQDGKESTKEYKSDLIMMDANRVELAQSKESRLTFTPAQSGVYYIDFKPGTNSRGYYVKAALK